MTRRLARIPGFPRVKRPSARVIINRYEKTLLLLCAGLVTCGLGRKAEQIAKEVEGSSRDYLCSVVGTIMFSPSGKLVYVAKKGEGQVVVVDGAEGPAYDRITYIAFVPALACATASPSSEVILREPGVPGVPGERLIYVAEKGDKKVMVDNGVPGKEYEDISDISFVPGGRVLYKARRGGRFAVVIDTLEGRFYDDVSGITYTLDFSHLAYWATEGDSSFVVLDGKEGPKYSKLPGGWKGIKRTDPGINLSRVRAAARLLSAPVPFMTCP